MTPEYTISNSHNNGKYKGAVRIYKDGELIAEASPNKHDKLKYIRDHPRSKYTLHLLAALRFHDAPDYAFKLLLP